MKMNPEVKALWLAALRGGEYQQADSVLCRVGEDGNRSYCCLGVLSDLAVKAGIGSWEDPASTPDGSLAWVGDGAHIGGSRTYMDYEVVEWSGVQFDGELPEFAMGEGTLSALNDSGATFAQIADIIEEQL